MQEERVGREIDDLLQEAYGEQLARLVAGSYRLAATVVELRAELQKARQITAPPAEPDT